MFPNLRCQYDVALQGLTEIAEVEPAAATVELALYHARTGRPDEAEDLLQAALAEANYANRPGGEAQVALARAYLQAGRPAEALELVQRALATPYRTAGLHHVAAEAHAALGHTEAAAAQRELLAAINPSYQGQEHTH